MTMKTARPAWRLCALAAAFALAPLTTHVAQADDWAVTGTVGLTTDYVFRGISQTDENPAIQGSIDVGHASGFYAGAWGSNVDFVDGENIVPGDEANAEIDYYGGMKGKFTDELGWDAGALYYSYPSAASDLDYDYWEGKLALGYSPSGMSMSPSLGLSVFYSPEFFGHIGAATYVNGSLGLKLTDIIGVSASIGNQQFSDSGPVDYIDYKVGVRADVAGVGLELGYTDTDLDKSDCGDTDWCEGRVLFTISKSL